MFSEASDSHSVQGGRGWGAVGVGYPPRYQVLSGGRIYLVPVPFWGKGITGSRVSWGPGPF